MIYKVVNVGGNNLTDRFIDENKINAMAKDGWKLVNITMPPSAQNNRFVCGTFALDDKPRFDANKDNKLGTESKPIDPKNIDLDGTARAAAIKAEMAGKK